MILERKIVRVGNSAGVILPKEWLYGKAKVIFLAPKYNIKKDVLEILFPYLEDILGIYLCGSHARLEQEEDSDIDIIAISKKTRKKITSERYNIEIYPADSIRKMLLHHPILIYPRLLEAKPIINNALLEELKTKKINKRGFKEFFDETRRMLKIDKEFLKIDKEKNSESCSDSIIYSAILRLRGFYLINCILKNKNYRKKEFGQWLLFKTGLNEAELKQAYEVYKKIRVGENVGESCSLNVGEKLYFALRGEFEKHGKKKKTT